MSAILLCNPNNFIDKEIFEAYNYITLAPKHIFLTDKITSNFNLEYY